MSHSDQSVTRLFKIPSLKVFALKNKASRFIQAYTSNQAFASRNAFLDRHGKIVAAVYQLFFSDEEVWLVLEASYESCLREHLKIYLGLVETTLEAMPHQVYMGEHQMVKGESAALRIGLQQTSLYLTQEEWVAESEGLAYTEFRVENSIPKQGIDFDHPMLLQLGDLSYVNFEKGCYLGQEIISRVHYKKVETKKLCVRYLDELSPEEQSLATSVIHEKSSGRQKGFVFL